MAARKPGEIDPECISDAHVRAVARDPERSFIVQAPAGSGKTELLTQRYLQLLATVDNPEEVLAVTFTRKAAAEMRNRIIHSIYPPPGKDKRLSETIEYAEAVVTRDRECNWNLKRYPARLRIRTIDSVNAWLSGTAPLVGQSEAIGLTETPDDLYRIAASRVVESLGPEVRDLLIHLDNSSDKLVRLIAGMLGRREQWLGITVEMGRTDGAQARAALEGVLHELVTAELKGPSDALSSSQKDAVLKYMHYAAVNFVEENPQSGWQSILEVAEFPSPDADSLPVWKYVCSLLLTDSGSMRKRLTKKEGFPVGSTERKEAKEEAFALIQSLGDIPGFESGLAAVRHLPAARYSDEQWQILESLLQVLNGAAVELQLVFAERGETDYTAVSQSALESLRDADGNPTDLALRMDFRIKHILIDEFQDTSSTQLILLQRLTEGWSENDGRTLFIVGDPMQSIYRFRKAEVGLFVDLQRHGLPNVELTPLTLNTNFRSDPKIIDWVNNAFRQVMPAVDDLTTGAISFSSSNAALTASDDAEVRVHSLARPSRMAEAERVVELVAEVRRRHPSDTVGILVRSRKHAELIVSGLQDRGISFSGTGLENSIETPIIQDLLCITRALSHRADRTAWLGLLRGPWCGLTLADLELLAGEDFKTCIWDLLLDETSWARMSNDGRARAQRIIDVIGPVFERRGALPLRDVVQGIWVELGGPACLTDAADLERAGAFFELLDDFDEGGDCRDAFDLGQQVSKRLKLEDRSADVNLMTIHKAKGLEFDTVILPALEAATRSDDKPVLAWQEVVTPSGRPGLVIAPIERTGRDKEAIFEYARRIDRQQAVYEQDRQLYVAATRAKKRMHMFVGLAINADSEELKPPPNNSLAGRLWPAIAHDIAQPDATDTIEASAEAWRRPAVARLGASWSVPSAPANYQVPEPLSADERQREVTYDWASPMAQHVGTIVHRWLERLTLEGASNYDEQRIRSMKPRFEHMLRADGLREEQLPEGAKLVAEALVNTLSDEKGRWLIDHAHTESAVELPITLWEANRMKSFVVDRTFVDADGVRWIVDYKTSSHGGGDLEKFFGEEERRYSDQLQGYKRALQALEPEREIRAALYFPLLKAFRPVAV